MVTVPTPGRGRLWERLARSRLSFVLVVVLLGAATAAGEVVLRQRVMAQAQAAAVEMAAVVADLSISPVVDSGISRTRALTPSEGAELNQHLSAVAERDLVLGLEIWSREGRLLYADSGHPVDETVMPPEELRRSLDDDAWVQPGDEDRGRPSFEVFVPYRADNGDFEAIVEVLMSQDTITTLTGKALRELLIAGVVLLVLLLAAFTAARRQLVRRERRSLLDPVTGLLNRFGFANVVREAGRRHQGESRPVVLVVDLDEFRTVNDSLGRGAADDLLVQVAGVLHDGPGRGDAAARIGADEFAVLVADVSARDTPAVLGHDLLDRLRNGSYTVGGVQLSVDAAVGGTVVDGDDPEVALRRAASAMARAKQHASHVAEYDADLDTRDVGHLELLVQLRKAIESDELVLYYQPQVRLDTGALVGVEALVRWRHPTRGLLAPGTFVPLAESTRFIQPMTDWVLAAAVLQAVEWRRDGIELTVAVNISPRVLLGKTFAAGVLDLLAEAGLPAELLEIEITESAVLDDPAQAFAVCEELATAGVRIAIDDFGAGYTSLSHLTALPVHTLKLDRQFITGMAQSPKQIAVVRPLLQLAHALGMSVVAEGVEDVETWRLLQDLDCDQAQGYYLARPMPATDLPPWVRDHLDAAWSVRA